MKKGVRFRIYPNKEQRQKIVRTFGCSRLVYNLGIDMYKEAHINGEKTSFKKTSAELPKLKKTEKYSFLKESDSVALQQSLRDLDKAYTNFFKKRAGYPKYKSKHEPWQSYRTQQDTKGTNIVLIGNRLKLPKLGTVRIKKSMEVGNISNATIERSPTGKFYAVLNVDFEPKVCEQTPSSIGIDMGIRMLYADSNGDKVKNPRNLKRSLRKLAREQRRLSRCKKGSNNRERQRYKVARVHEVVTNRRNDFLQKTSTALVRENQTICVEDLSVKEMLLGKGEPKKKRKNINRAVMDTGMGMFLKMIEYKCKWYGRELRKVPKDFPSSRLCFNCGYDNPALSDVKLRKWTCPCCGAVHDRDINAARNILACGMKMPDAA